MHRSDVLSLSLSVYLRSVTYSPMLLFLSTLLSLFLPLSLSTRTYDSLICRLEEGDLKQAAHTHTHVFGFALFGGRFSSFYSSSLKFNLSCRLCSHFTLVMIMIITIAIIGREEETSASVFVHLHPFVDRCAARNDSPV